MIKKPRPDYELLVPRVASGELTRRQAAQIAHEKTGLSPGTFLVWLSKQRLNLPHGAAGAHSIHSHAKNHPDKALAYEQATEMVLKNQATGPQAAKKFDVSYTYLMYLVGRRRKPDNARKFGEKLELAPPPSMPKLPNKVAAPITRMLGYPSAPMTVAGYTSGDNK